MNDLKIISMVNNFPIGEKSKTRLELLSKIEIVSYLSRFQDQFSSIENVDDREFSVKSFLGDLIGLEPGEVVPDLSIAENNLKISPGFLQDYGKVQLVKDSEPSFDQTFDIISNTMKLTNTNLKVR